MSDRTVVFPAPGHKERRLLAFDAPAARRMTSGRTSRSAARTDGPTLCLIAGIHGAEYPPIDARDALLPRRSTPATLRGRVVAVPVVNLPAFWERTPFVCPRDGKNPNRVFPGDAARQLQRGAGARHVRDGDPARRRIWSICTAGDMVEELAPFSLVQQTGRCDARRDGAGAGHGLRPALSGACRRRRGGPVAGTTNAAAAQAGIPAVIAEAGGVGQLQAEAVELHLRGLRPRRCSGWACWRARWRRCRRRR